MAKRFIICTNSAAGVASGLSADQRNLITQHLKSKQGWQVWHWFEDLWLVVAPDSTYTNANAIRVELTNLLGPLKHVLVMQVEGPIRYGGMGPPDGWPWMAELWGTPES